MQLVIKEFLDELEPIITRDLANQIIGHRDSLYFLSDKLFEERPIMDYPYIHKNTVLPIKRKIVRTNKLVQKFLLDISSRMCFPIEHYKHYSAQDKQAMATAIHQIYSAAVHVTLAFRTESMPHDQQIRRVLDELLQLPIYRYLSQYNQSIREIANTDILPDIKHL